MIEERKRKAVEVYHKVRQLDPFCSGDQGLTIAVAKVCW